jgi:hypothetical protein
MAESGGEFAVPSAQFSAQQPPCLDRHFRDNKAPPAEANCVLYCVLLPAISPPNWPRFFAAKLHVRATSVFQAAKSGT